jgi:outer membrane protein assembly factor BamE
MSSFWNNPFGQALSSLSLSPAPHLQRSAICKTLLGLAILAGLSACSSTNSTRSGIFEAYKVDLPQGNYVTQEMVAQIRTGMSADQVRFALGAPLLNSLFQPDIWSYVFRYKHAGGKIDLRRLVIHFKDQRVASIEGDDLPPSEDGSDPFLPGYKGPPVKSPQK